MKLTGHTAIEYAETHNLPLCKYADPIEDFRDDLTPEEASAVADEDPSLIYVEEKETMLNPEIAEYCADNHLPLPADTATANAAWAVADPEDLTIQAADMVALFPGRPEMHTTMSFRLAMGLR